jgi:hypothetical protein
VNLTNVLCAVALRKQDFHRLADHFACAIAERLLGSVVENQYASVFVSADH